VISLFHETKIPMVDMKVQVYSRFSKNEIWKKMKSPSSMRNGRFYPLKCRGKKWECCTPFSQNARPILIIPKNKIK
jgi:hypothetical protein